METFNRDEFFETHSKYEIFELLKTAKAAMQEAKLYYEDVENEAIQVAARLEKTQLDELKVQYRAGYKLYDLSNCDSIKAINAKLTPLKEELKEAEKNEKAFFERYYKDSSKITVDGSTGEVIEPQAIIKGISKGAIILK